MSRFIAVIFILALLVQVLIARIETLLNDKELSNPFAFLTVVAAASYVKGYQEVNKEALDLASSIIKP